MLYFLTGLVRPSKETAGRLLSVRSQLSLSFPYLSFSERSLKTYKRIWIKKRKEKKKRQFIISWGIYFPMIQTHGRKKSRRGFPFTAASRFDRSHEQVGCSSPGLCTESRMTKDASHRRANLTATLLVPFAPLFGYNKHPTLTLSRSCLNQKILTLLIFQVTNRTSIPHWT